MSTPIKDNIEMRSLETLDSHLEKYKNHGSDPKFAKLCDNFIDQRLFNVPLDQFKIGIPPLHILLGTYLKFFNMLENSCHTIDVKIACRMAVNNQTLDCEEFNKYIEKQCQIKQLQISIQDIEDKICIITEALETHILANPENEEYIKLVFKPRIIHFEEKKKEKISELKIMKETDHVKMSFGPLVNKLDEVLNLLGVQRQAYHGKSFVGNHVSKMFKMKSILQLCNSILKLVVELGFKDTDINNETIELSQNYKVLFDKFGVCHKLINSCKQFNEENIQNLENHIEEFMKYFMKYRNNWPNDSITPKLHMLEYHASSFIRKWGVGLGIYGEQGAESIHVEFNSMKITYWHIKETRKLKSIMDEHFLKNHPTVKKYQQKPLPKKEKIADT
ncbi:uncharacterized protein LOC124814664 isoform X2 [Hydra vulgaris]|nr:uncharacterized protein LOC124814664 isoform X2 [Hydra vulgaris]XP_047138534.1 uncharacterized protein LOC124814664 isoform X2 [Hydra vulgaris]XP_047138535.1 uncharacterized protein LOC124814664 isoform X2 [Hydra vulgaris]